MVALRLLSAAAFAGTSAGHGDHACADATCAAKELLVTAGDASTIKMSMLQKTATSSASYRIAEEANRGGGGAVDLDTPDSSYSSVASQDEPRDFKDVEARPASGAGALRVFVNGTPPEGFGAQQPAADENGEWPGSLDSEIEAEGYWVALDDYFDDQPTHVDDEYVKALARWFSPHAGVITDPSDEHSNISGYAEAATFRAGVGSLAVADGCATFGCVAYKHGRKCQCNASCKKYEDCCSDYVKVCAKVHAQSAATTTTTLGPTTPAAPVLRNTTGPLRGVFGHPSAKIRYPRFKGFTLVLAEEFDEPIDLERDPIWTWSDGGLRESAVRFVKEQVLFEDGKMIIEVSNKRPYPEMQSCSMASKEYVPHKPLISGELRSRYNMFRYGRYETRMKAPEVQPGNPDVNGNYIATMFVYRDANAHHWREIDFELTGDRTNSLTLNLLVADGTKNWRPYLQDSRKPWLKGVNLRKDFHTYAFEWTSSKVTWFFEGKVVREGTRLKNPDKSCKIMMNTWIFGPGSGFGGWEKHNNRYPMRTEYEYFRFYKWNEETEYPCDDMGPSCLTEDDHYLATNNPCDGIEQKGLLYGRRVCKATCKDPALNGR
eukprot:TRINITY_DN3237_c0_g1_i1.p1 TRINITY_DN3237_c0_g1~~TRINITY_DN3237_c0_g1_i1.p1  ORF type:complete len:603 (-),score=97.36 TRINITY_DN3237_c0_g1_i1:144-1952(-)